MSNFAVINAKRIAPSGLVAFSRHEARSMGDLSHIDPSLTPLNERIIGNFEDPREAVAEHLERTGARIPKGNDKPFTALVLTASPDFFERDPQNPRRFVEAAKGFLSEEFGDACVYACWHRDEKTDHIHALIVPTVDEAQQAKVREERAPRRQAAAAAKREQVEALADLGLVEHHVRPSRAKQRPGESDADFEARKRRNEAKRRDAKKAAGAAPEAPARKPRKVEGALVSHQQHPAFHGFRSYAGLQDRWSEAVEHLGLERGVRGSSAKHTTKREWVASLLKDAGREASAIVGQAKTEAAQLVGRAKSWAAGFVASERTRAAEAAARDAERAAEVAKREQEVLRVSARLEAAYKVAGRPDQAAEVSREVAGLRRRRPEAER